MNYWRHKLAYWLRLLAWKIDPRPELQEHLADLIRNVDPQDTPFSRRNPAND